MEDVVFRAVKPEQIQMAIAMQGTKEDQKIYDMDWSEWSQSPSEASDDKEPVNLLAAADTSDLLRSKGLVQAMGAISAAQQFEDPHPGRSQNPVVKSLSTAASCAKLPQQVQCCRDQH